MHGGTSCVMFCESLCVCVVCLHEFGCHKDFEHCSNNIKFKRSKTCSKKVKFYISTDVPHTHTQTEKNNPDPSPEAEASPSSMKE